MRISSAAPVRRYLSEADEKTALKRLKEQLCHQKHVTSDDVRVAVRAVASQGGARPLPPDFPPSRWVLEFKRVHGFMQLSSFVFSADFSSRNIKRGSKTTTALEQPTRRDMQSAESHIATTTPDPTTSPNIANSNSSGTSSASVVQTTDSSPSSGNTSDDEKEKGSSKDSIDCGTTRMALYSMTASNVGVPLDDLLKRQGQLKHSFGQRHLHHLQQQQRRAMLVEDRRRATARPVPMSQTELIHESVQATAMVLKHSLGGRRDAGSSLGPSISLSTSHVQCIENSYESSGDAMQDTAHDVLSSGDNRGYKLSHTVPADTWEKAIAAVEQQGMSLRAAARLFGVHFAALHRRVKKRAQNGKEKGTNGYFHPSDEAGIMRVVVARAELGVLMTFAELMRLVEAAALRKLPDLSIKGARKLLTRFQSRNAESIQHIIDDWPLVRPPSDDDQSQPYIRHPGFDYGASRTGSGRKVGTSETLVETPVYANPTNDPRLLEGRLIDTMRAMVLGITTSAPFSNSSD